MRNRSKRSLCLRRACTLGVCAALTCIHPISDSRAQPTPESAHDKPPSRAGSAAKRGVEAPPAPQPPLRAEEAAGRPIKTPELKLDPRTLASLDQPVMENLPKIDGGAIPRVALNAELQRGIGAFLGQVRTKPAAHNGRFVGWRLIELFKKRSDVHVKGLKAGDTVLKINGRSLERPEQFKFVWDSLSNADELVIEIERQGRRCQLHYAIVS
jgi:hypothetical protein